jgi:hypothetical protein
VIKHQYIGLSNSALVVVRLCIIPVAVVVSSSRRLAVSSRRLVALSPRRLAASPCRLALRPRRLVASSLPCLIATSRIRRSLARISLPPPPHPNPGGPLTDITLIIVISLHNKLVLVLDIQGVGPETESRCPKRQIGFWLSRATRILEYVLSVAVFSLGKGGGHYVKQLVRLVDMDPMPSIGQSGQLDTPP